MIIADSSFQCETLRFTAEIERKFQARYFERVRPTLRLMTPLLAAMFGTYAVRDFLDTHSVELTVSQNGAYPSLLSDEFRTAFIVACPLRGS